MSRFMGLDEVVGLYVKVISQTGETSTLTAGHKDSNGWACNHLQDIAQQLFVVVV